MTDMEETAQPTQATARRVVGVRFKVAGMIYDFDANALDVAVGDPVIVEGERGTAMATVATPPREWLPEGDERGARLLRVLKKADPEERKRFLNSRPFQKNFTEDERKLIEQMANDLPDRE